MKPTLLLIFVTIWIKPAQSQDQYSLVHEGAVWVQENFASGNFAEAPFSYAELRIEGDTLIEGLLYQKLFASGQTYFYGPPQLRPGYAGGIREADKRVLWYHQNSIDTLLDFNLLVGDTFHIPQTNPDLPPQYMLVTNIDSIQVADLSFRKRINFEGYNATAGFVPQDTFRVAWIDGIGSTRGLLTNTTCGVFNNGRSPVCFERLACHLKEGELLFTNTENRVDFCGLGGIITSNDRLQVEAAKWSVFPNPFAEFISLQAEGSINANNWQLKITDLYGRQLFEQKLLSADPIKLELSSLPSGLYLLQIVNQSSEYSNVFKIQKR